MNTHNFKVGDRVTMLDTITEPADGDSPAQLLCCKGEVLIVRQVTDEQRPRNGVWPVYVSHENILDRSFGVMLDQIELARKSVMNIYVASSWRNVLQPAIVSVLRSMGHEVYDFRNPAPGNNGFSWSEIDPDWQNWTPEQYRDALDHPIVKAGYEYDITALRNCDACVLVLPSGRSASWEFGWALGNGKHGAVVMLEKCEPELMYLGNPILTSMDELMDWAQFPAAC